MGDLPFPVTGSGTGWNSVFQGEGEREAQSIGGSAEMWMLMRTSAESEDSLQPQASTASAGPPGAQAGSTTSLFPRASLTERCGDPSLANPDTA